MKNNFYIQKAALLFSSFAFLLCTHVSQAQMVTTIAGTGAWINTQTGVQATTVGFKNLNGIAADAAGNLYVCESDQYRIFKIAPTGIITVFAGNGAINYTGDGGPATSAGIGRPEKIAISSLGEVYFSSTFTHTVRKIDNSGIITTVVGTGVGGFSGDGGLATAAQIGSPMGLAFDSAGNLYILDTGSPRIRKVAVGTGIISTYAGTGVLGNSGNGGPATAAQINGTSLAMDANDNLYINNSYSLRKIDGATQIISHVAGDPLYAGYTGDGGLAVNARLAESFDIKFDAAGNLYWPHWSVDHVIRKISTTGIITTIAGIGTWGFGGDGGDPLYATFHGMNAMTFDAAGNLYVADNINRRIRKIDFLAAPVCGGPLSIIKTLGANGSATISHTVTPTAGTPTYTGVLTGNPSSNPMTAVNYTTTNSYSFTFPGNGIYNIAAHYYDTVSGLVCHRTLNDTILISNSNTPKQFNRRFSTSNPFLCDGDSIRFKDSTSIVYSLTNPSATYTITTQWGNGVTTTHTVNATNQLNFTSGYVVYPFPGVYTVQSILQGPGMQNDTVVIAVNTLTCGNVLGRAYNDPNNDCGFGFGDVVIPNMPVTLSNGSGAWYSAWTDASGQYNFSNIPAGTYTIQCHGANLGYTTSCAMSMPHTITVGSGSVYTDFAMNCTPGFDIATTGISLFNGFFPGQTDYILPHVGMLNASCNFVVPGKVKMVLTPCIQYVPGGTYAHPPDLIIPAATGDTLVWNVADINNIGNFSYWNYAVHVTTCTSAVVGDSACITMIVMPTAGDVNPANNTFTFCFEIGVSYDPNYKSVIPAGAGIIGEIPAATPELEYTLHFQNTGTAPAMNVYLLDTISTNLDISSIEIISASHSMQPYMLPNRTIKFMFANINLPDSTHNEPQSHGYVNYRINLNPGLAPGTQIKNTGYIYFDYNVPVVTNTALNTIETIVGLKNTSAKTGMLIYPNPANDKITVRFAKASAATIVISDLLGREIITRSSNDLQTTIETASLKEGVYIVKAQQDGVTYMQKVVIGK
jgi:hypothetical protein